MRLCISKSGLGKNFVDILQCTILTLGIIINGQSYIEVTVHIVIISLPIWTLYQANFRKHFPGIHWYRDLNSSFEKSKYLLKIANKMTAYQGCCWWSPHERLGIISFQNCPVSFEDLSSDRSQAPSRGILECYFSRWHQYQIDIKRAPYRSSKYRQRCCHS